MDEYQLPFLKQFEGSVSSTSVTHNSVILEQKRKICVDEVKACPENMFNKTITNRSKCAACEIVAGEIDTLKKTINTKIMPLRDILESETFCSRLGTNFAPPYGWLETLCEEMVEDRVGAILEILAFHDQIARTGMAPSQTASEMMCAEFFQCGEGAKGSVEKNNKKNKTGKKSTTQKSMKTTAKQPSISTAEL